MCLILPKEWHNKFLNFSRSINVDNISFQSMCSFLGLVVSSSNAFLYAPLYYRIIQICFVNCFKIFTSWEEEVQSNTEAREDIDWWSFSKFKFLTPAPFNSNEPDSILFTDACLTSWGASLSTGQTTIDSWTSKDSTYHINFLELKAIHLAVRIAFYATDKNKIYIYVSNQIRLLYCSVLHK